MNRQPRPTEFEGIRFRSKSEAQFAFWLNQMGYRWQYEPSTLQLECGYVPDFVVVLHWRHTFDVTLVEYKPRKPSQTYLDECRGKLDLLSNHVGFPCGTVIAWGGFYGRPDECGQQWASQHGEGEITGQWLHSRVTAAALRKSREYRYDLSHGPTHIRDIIQELI